MSTSASPASERGPGAAPPPAEDRAARRARRAIVLFFVGAAAAVGIGFLLVSLDSTEPVADLRLTSWRPDPAALAAQTERDAARKASLRFGPDEEAVAEAVATYNRIELEAGADPLSPRLREAQADLRQRLQRYAGQRGIDGYHALGLHLRDRFVASLGDVLTGARTSGERPQLYVDRRPFAPDVEVWQRWAGSFLRQAAEAGLILPDGALAPGAEHVPGLFFLVRWFHWIHPVTDYTFRLSDVELYAFWAWKAEQSEGLPLERRLDLVQQVVRVRPSYPAGFVRGVLFAREDRWREAAAEWERWLAEHPRDERARENLRFAAEVLASRHARP